MKERKVVESDNRESDTTWLHLEDGTYIEVNPAELFSNMIENNVESKLLELMNVDDEISVFLERFNL